MSDFASICVLSYERPEFLRTCLESVSANAGYPVEVIVHDDGSANPMVRELILDGIDQGLISHAILNPAGNNEGQGIALNRMFTMAKGDPIVKCDQDLIFSPDWLITCVELLKANRHAVLEAGDNIEPPIGVLGLFKYWTDPVDHRKMFIKDWGFPAYEWEEVTDFVGSALVVPRDVWEAFGPFEERSLAFAEDQTFKFMVRDQGDMKLALVKGADLVVNQGFGVGPSTVVTAPGTVAQIQPGPRLAGVTPNYVRPIVPGTGSEAS